MNFDSESLDDFGSQESLSSKNSKSPGQFDSRNPRIQPITSPSGVNTLNDFNDSSNVSISSDEYDRNEVFLNQSLDKSLDESDSRDDSLYLPSPNLSRNSTTSCLSTTATKDGVEGRKLHRNGPNPYSNQLIANMIKNLDDKKLAADEKQLRAMNDK
ncbi:hypothetical protein CLIB1444_13S03686 [[Candida] jaroonii]|uniref:Uncharacterized protein n=1 Tax=[Candida] jaroonii TaxID=467808 RepID=A0ACA9YEF6_9ASCO|nr:hypothetical protein CLIB1444_13S03686 [[Candida] jaroonii]